MSLFPKVDEKNNDSKSFASLVFKRYIKAFITLNLKINLNTISAYLMFARISFTEQSKLQKHIRRV